MGFLFGVFLISVGGCFIVCFFGSFLVFVCLPGFVLKSVSYSVQVRFW